ncbi:L-gulonolactone oxidase 3 [Lycium barbarum]|uniref:L-gulonolactone oxidase 3 n=1 Tax=Lycium barbarum TaxID=112863 RepID=UPI00293E60D0|nr:L-gulonolactone oxidase 3 [Lycium barbarum]
MADILLWLCHGHHLVLLWISIATLLTISSSMPPPDPIKCNNINSTSNCQLSNSYGVWGDRQTCHAPKIVYPTTEEELRDALANGNKNNLKVKIVTRFSHTIPKLACPGNSKEFVFISTEKYDSNIDINMEELTVTADGGVGLRKLIDTIEKAKLSLVAATYWEGVTVAGVISTGAHGSSWWGKGGAVHDHVIGLSLIVPANEFEGYAKIIKLTPHDPLFNAAKVSLGLLGIISKVTFQLEPAFKRSIRFNFTNDSHIEDEFMEHARKNEFGDIQWYPSRHIAVYRYDNRVPLNTSGDGVNDFLGFQSNPILLSKSVRATEKGYENARNVGGKCIMASSFVAYKKLIANGLKNNKLIFTGYPVVGHQGKMQTSGSCLYSSPLDITSTCAWDPRINGLFFYESTAILPHSNFGDFIRDVKKLRDLAKPESMCGVDIYNGFLFRFIKASEAYLGEGEDSVVVDFNYYRASDALTPRLNQDIWEEVEQMAFVKYGAKPHWAKNRNVAFLDAQKKYPKFNKFVAAKNELDPKNIFSSEWSDEILFGKQEGLKGDGCALEGLCICSEDRHCSPSKGYFCKPGLVYQEARVCRFSSTSTR